MASGKSGELIVTELHGKFYQQNYSKALFHYGTPSAGVTLTTAGSTVQTFGIWNPTGSVLNIIPTKCRITQVGATGTVAAFGWTAGVGLGAVVAGTSPVTAATFVTQVPGNFNLNNQVTFNSAASVARVFSTITLATAPTIIRWTGFGWGAPLATTPAAASFIDDFDGDVIVSPGTALFLSCSGAPGAAVAVSLTWEEQAL